MRSKLLIIPFLTFALIVAGFFPPQLFADQFDCQNYSGHCLTSFSMEAKCDSKHNPYIHFTWQNQFGDSYFNIVYTHNGNWFQFHVGKVTSADLPPNVGDNGSLGDGVKDTSPLKVGQVIGGKISGGYPKWLGGPGLTTGYTNPDKATTVPDCTPNTPTPTNSPTPSGPAPTNTPGPQTKAKVVLFFPGVGAKYGGNANPGRKTRNVTLYFYKPTDDPSDPSIQPIKRTGTVTLDQTTGSQTLGYFINTSLDLGGFSGTYKVLVKSNQYLRKQFIPKSGDNSQTYTFTPGQTTTLPTVTLIAGDILPPPAESGGEYGDNTLDISDYNALARDCYGGKASGSGCANKEGADLNDDGHVDGIDYNILLRSFNILANEGTQGGDGE